MEICNLCDKKHNVNTNIPNALYWIGNLCDKKHNANTNHQTKTMHGIDILDGMEIGHGMEITHSMEMWDGMEVCNLCDKKHNVNTNNPNALYWRGKLCDKNTMSIPTIKKNMHGIDILDHVARKNGAISGPPT